MTEESMEAIARRDRGEAHRQARERVAANPKSETAAHDLRELMRRFPPVPKNPEPDPLAGAADSVRQAAALLDSGEAEQAEVLLRQHLARTPSDPVAMWLMARIAMDCDYLDNAYKILRRSLEIDRSRADNWAELGKVIYRIATKSGDLELVEESIAALDYADTLVADHLEAGAFKAAILIQVRRLDEAVATLERMLEAHPQASYPWTNYGFVLKTLGRFGEAVAAYRTSVAVDPENCDGWWGLANLKLSRLFDFDIADIEQLLPNAPARGQVMLHFALADAYDFRGDFERAARHLEIGNRLRFEDQPHDSSSQDREAAAIESTYTPAFFVARAHSGEPSNAPIFILGLPRSGSTLVEQILASHSMIEGTEELFAMLQIEKELRASGLGRSAPFETGVSDLEPAKLRELGERYLELTQYIRRTNRPHFTDKNPANWRQVGLIHAILPNARIIDVRRDPMDCCFGNYRQHFNAGADFSYSQKEVALAYRHYLRVMRHFDRAMPGVVHRVVHNDLVDDLEGEVRKLLVYLKLPFEENCLRFFETERAVHTPSSEQVRQPIDKASVGKWRNYEPWLSELRQELGEAAADWRS